MFDLIPEDAVQAIEKHFDEMIRMQRDKVLRMARQRIPHLTPDDVLNAHDFPALLRDWDFQFEDGVLGGLIQSQISLRANFFRRRPDPLPQPAPPPSPLTPESEESPLRD